MEREEKISTVDGQYICTFRPDPEGGYSVRCTAFPGLITSGSNLEEARAMAREALQLCVEVYRANGWAPTLQPSTDDIMAARSQGSGKLDIPVSAEARRVLQEAARERHTTLRQFVIDSALNTAHQVLAERTRIDLNSAQWAAFLAALDAPPQRHPRMERLLNEASVLD